MRIYYKVFLSSEEEDDAQILSMGMTADNGLSAYGEVNDYLPEAVAPDIRRDVVEYFLGNKGIDEAIATQKKTKAMIAPAFRVNEFFNGFLSPYKTIELIGFSNYLEASEMLRMIDLENAAKQVTLLNYSVDMMEKYEGLFDHVSPDLPEGNALRWALFYKHVARKHERIHGASMRSVAKQP